MRVQKSKSSETKWLTSQALQSAGSIPSEEVIEIVMVRFESDRDLNSDYNFNVQVELWISRDSTSFSMLSVDSYMAYN